jgi:hypothetical protein
MDMQMQHDQHQKNSLLVITLNKESAQKSMLDHKFIFGWGHPMQIKEYLNTKLTQECLKCWSLTHNTSTYMTQYKMWRLTP